jgi:hypothetical protein
MKKIILMVLFGLSLTFNAFAQDEFRQKKLTLVEKQTHLDSIARENCDIKKSSSLLMRSYSNQLVAREVLNISGGIFILCGLSMINSGNNDMRTNPKSSSNYQSGKTNYNAGNALVYIGGASFVASYTIHLSSIGTLRKYALKHRLEELRKK